LYFHVIVCFVCSAFGCYISINFFTTLLSEQRHVPVTGIRSLHNRRMARNGTGNLVLIRRMS